MKDYIDARPDDTEFLAEIGAEAIRFVLYSYGFEA